MAKLTKEQRAFLKRMNIPLSKVGDYEGWKTAAYRAEMKVQDQLLAIGVTPCNKAGHTMRTRKGHCAQCDPKQLGYLMRYDVSGEVYVATSSIGYIKVGSGKDASQRLINLNSYNYGGASDWRLEIVRPCTHANRAEVEAHRLLHRYQAINPVPVYFKNGKWIECRELFKCSLDIAIDAVTSSIRLHGNECMETTEDSVDPLTCDDTGADADSEPPLKFEADALAQSMKASLALLERRYTDEILALKKALEIANAERKRLEYEADIRVEVFASLKRQSTDEILALKKALEIANAELKRNVEFQENTAAVADSQRNHDDEVARQRAVEVAVAEAQRKHDEEEVAKQNAIAEAKATDKRIGRFG